MELSPRLLKIASLVPAGSSLADVGTDHGYIPVYCFENNIITKAIPMDINPQPLQRAKVNLKKYGYDHLSDFRLSDGLEKLSSSEADVIVIAGMGGLLIKEILEKGKEAIGDETLLLLQPMIAPNELRIYLYDNGYDITDEYVVREENKFYNIFAVKRGEFIPGDEHIYVGKNLAINSPEDIEAYLDYKIRVCNKIISGMEKSESPDRESIQKCNHEKNIYMKYREELPQ